MKTLLVAALAATTLALTPASALAQKKAPAVAGKACLTAAQTCSTDCNKAGYCVRMTCAAGQWTKKLVGCFGSLCPPKC